MTKFLQELNRRNVVRVAVAYLVGAWVLLQVADLVLDNIGAPDWVMQALLLLCALCFPLIIAFSWAFELTPDGLKRETEVDRSVSITRATAQRLDRITIALLVLVLVVVAAERFMPGPAIQAEPEAITTDASAPAVDEKSIAVLAFADLSAEGDQTYFADGISEELLNTLAKIPDLKVAGRTSSFAFRDQQRDLREIGEILEVAYILEGSVRKSGNMLRITAQLVKAADGFHLFSENYDRQLTDIFKVQDDIARQIAAALRSVIMGEDAIDAATPTDPAVYNNYLRARQWIHTRNKDLMTQAAELLDRALDIDPDYAPAYAQQAIVTILLSDSIGSYGDIPIENALSTSRSLINTALELDPDLAEAYAALGLWHMINDDYDSQDAVQPLYKALRINPNLSDAQIWLSSALDYRGQQKESIALAESLIERDPLNPPIFSNLILRYIHSGQVGKAEALIRRIESITGETANTFFARGGLYHSRKNLADAVAAFGAAVERAPGAGLIRAWLGFALLQIGEFERASDEGLLTQRLIGLELTGRHDQAVELLGTLQNRSFQDIDISNIANWFQMQGRAADLVDFFEDHFREQGGILRGMPRSRQLIGNLHLTEIAYALRETGRSEDAETLLQDIRELIADISSNEPDNVLYWLHSAQYAAIVGDKDSLYDAMRKAIDSGYLAVRGFYHAPFNNYRHEKPFIKLDSESINGAELELRKLRHL